MRLNKVSTVNSSLSFPNRWTTTILMARASFGIKSTRFRAKIQPSPLQSTRTWVIMYFLFSRENYRVRDTFTGPPIDFSLSGIKTFETRYECFPFLRRHKD